MISRKVILTGNFGVGKTSLFNRFLYNRFSEKYLTTIGVSVDKKVVEIDGVTVNLILWDIAGEVDQNKVPHSYFLGSSGVIYVFDVNRKPTYEHMERDLAYLEEKLPGVVIKIVGNKIDLLDTDGIASVAKELSRKPDYWTSAKNGESVEDVFVSMAASLLE
ncbi:MAG: Rab family GTPase [Bacteroidota bacterium]